MIIFHTLANLFRVKKTGDKPIFSKFHFSSFGEMHGKVACHTYISLQESEDEESKVNEPVPFYVPHEIPWRKGVSVKDVLKFMKNVLDTQMPFGVELYEENNVVCPYVCFGCARNVWFCATKKYKNKMTFRNIKTTQFEESNQFGVLVYHCYGQEAQLAAHWQSRARSEK